MKCCLIGETLKHSLSKSLHQKMGEYSYDLVEVAKDELKDFVRLKKYDAYNVTIPYKSLIMPLLDEVSDLSRIIGAVNTVVLKNGKLRGYNTDFYGMKYLLTSSGFDLAGKKVMILGSGGTSKTAVSVANNLGADSITLVSRTGKINYENCYDVQTDFIINTTPVGTFPNQMNSPIDLSRFSNILGVMDVVYNPLKTKLLFQAKELNVKNVGGLKMLVAQAKFARDLFLNGMVKYSERDEEIEKLYEELVKSQENVVLIGMAGCGKSTIGKKIASITNKKFIDTDQVIENKMGLSIPEIFEKFKEDYFRKLEREVIKELSLERGAVIATGGGVVINEENKYPLKCSGKVVWVKRDLKLLSTNGRPLSKNYDSVVALYKERENLYNSFADVSVDNDEDLETVVKKVVKLCEY